MVLSWLLTHRKSFGDFSYMVSANIATNHNEIKDMGESDDIIQNGGDKIRYILREGESIGSFFGLKTDGLYTQEEIVLPVIIILTVVNRKPVISSMFRNARM